MKLIQNSNEQEFNHNDDLFYIVQEKMKKYDEDLLNDHLRYQEKYKKLAAKSRAYRNYRNSV